MRREDLKAGRRYWFYVENGDSAVESGYYTGNQIRGIPVLISNDVVYWRVNAANLYDYDISKSKTAPKGNDGA